MSSLISCIMIACAATLARGETEILENPVSVQAAFPSVSETLIEVTFDNKASSLGRTLYTARGSSSCWGIPGWAPQMDGSFTAVPDEKNTACPASAEGFDYSAGLIIGLNFDYSWDVLHKLEKQAGQIKLVGLAKKVSGVLQWQYSCITLSGGDPAYKVTCSARAPTHSYAKYAYSVTVENARGETDILEKPVSVEAVVPSVKETLIEVTFDNKASSLGRTLYTARGSSSCWGIPGWAPQMDGSFNAVPDEKNTACPASAEGFDYSAGLIIGLNFDYSWDVLHKLEKQAGQIKLVGLAKKVSGVLQWQYSCITLSGGDPAYKVTCSARAPTHSYAKYAYSVTIENAATTVLV